MYGSDLWGEMVSTTRSQSITLVADRCEFHSLGERGQRGMMSEVVGKLVGD